MIGSALMTTMTLRMDNLGQVFSYSRDETNLAIDLGVIDLIVALYPSLVYDISPQTYVDFICGLNSVGPPYLKNPYTTFFCETSCPRSPTTPSNNPRPIHFLNFPSLFTTFYEDS